jgi:hypothetical protein
MKRLLPLLAVPAFLLAGCSAGTTTVSPASSATTTSATTTSAPASGDTTATTGAPATGSTTSSSGQGASSTARCHTADLSLRLGGADAAAGTYHQNLIFKNKSGHKCTLYGYPGVSWVTGDSGAQVNAPLQRNPGTKKTITLAVGGQAHAVVITHSTGAFDPGKCKPVPVRGYRVYPPDETTSIFVSQSGTECAATGVNLGQVLPIESGAGTTGE